MTADKSETRCDLAVEETNSRQLVAVLIPSCTANGILICALRNAQSLTRYMYTLMAVLHVSLLSSVRNTSQLPLSRELLM